MGILDKLKFKKRKDESVDQDKTPSKEVEEKVGAVPQKKKEKVEVKKEKEIVKDVVSSKEDSRREKKEETKNKPKTVKSKGKGQSYGIIIKPLITEKASFLGESNKYVFEVAITANKIEIKNAIRAVYGVKPASIKTISIRGKNIRYGRTTGKRKNWKKAIVTLKSGDKIEVYEGV